MEEKEFFKQASTVLLPLLKKYLESNNIPRDDDFYLYVLCDTLEIDGIQTSQNLTNDLVEGVDEMRAYFSENALKGSCSKCVEKDTLIEFYKNNEQDERNKRWELEDKLEKVRMNLELVKIS